MDPQCAQCLQKDDLISKYLKLIKLLKTKCEKSSKSIAKNTTLPSDTLYQTSLENSQSLTLNLNHQMAKSDLIHEKSPEIPLKNTQLNLALLVISHRMKTYLLKQSFFHLKTFNHNPKLSNTSANFDPQINSTQINLQTLISETLTKGKSFQNQSQIQRTKSLEIQILHLEIENHQLNQKMAQLQKQLTESEKRFMKEMEKKRESLETFGQEIKEKTEMITELQMKIQMYENQIGKKFDNHIGNVLDDDLEEFKANCQRLENVNQKLNNGVKALEETVQGLNKQINSLKVTNNQLKDENEHLKEKVFDLSHQLSHQDQISRTYTNLLKKLSQKLQLIKLKEKEILANSKIPLASIDSNIKQLQVTQSSGARKHQSSGMVSTKITEESCSENHIKVDKLTLIKDSKELEAEQKIEEIFAFLFNIRQEKYQIQNDHIFDEDEKELLRSHKEIFLSHVAVKDVKDDSMSMIRKKSLKDNLQMDQSDFIIEKDSVFYSQNSNPKHSNKEIHDESVLCAFDPIKQVKMESKPQVGNQMKLIELEIQKSKLIEKISQLKGLQMHIRNVVLNLMKTVDLSPNKPETASILEVVFDFFEYSEDQKAAIFKDKKKKFWGLI